MSEHYFRLLGSEPPWGDYGDILQNGMVSGMPDFDDTKEVLVERAGPFVPPISFPFGVALVTEDFGTKLDAMGFSGVSFRDATYSKVVPIDWQDWDQSAEEPAKYPAGGEPENYILTRKHAPDLAASMPKLSALVAEQIDGLQKLGTSSVLAHKLPRLDFFKANMLLFVSERAASFLIEHVNDWIECEPASIVSE